MKKNILFNLFYFFSFLALSQDNDELSSAIFIECGSEIESTTVGYSSDQTILTTYGLNNCGTSVDAASGVWYYLDGIDDDIFISACNSSYDTKIHIFSDDGFALSCVIGNDDSSCESSGLHSQVQFFSELNKVYYVYVSGYGTSEGNFVFSVNCGVVIGCMDSEACNYDDNVTFNDGSCVLPNECDSCDNNVSCLGCIDELACNYDVNATLDDGSCVLPNECDSCDGDIFCIGCTDSNATNYNELATYDDGSCDTDGDGIPDNEEVSGCTDSNVLNYNALATDDDNSCLYDLNCDVNEIQIDILLATDPYPNETSFVLNDNTGIPWADEDDIFTTSYTNYPFQYCLPIGGCYIFTLYDSYGDGIFSSGGIQVFYESNLVLEDPDFAYSSTITMNCPEGYACNTAEEVNLGSHQTSSDDYWYVFTPEANGQYEINSCESDCNTVIYVYDYCLGLVPSDYNDGTIYYSDDECGLQSQLFPLMTAGDEYYIRVKADCDNIDWEINYIGPVSGCTDTAACNYNPIAEIEDDSCLYPGDPDCTSGPDLMVMPFEDSMYLDVYSNADGCAIEEGCLTGYDTRYLVRFSTWIKNIGDQDYFIGSVDDNENTGQFEWDECHNHWHYKGYAEYVLFDTDGQIIPVGFKNGFCVMDLECGDGGTYTYGCSVMGISAGCGDIYGAGLSCQWIDITDVPDGEYTFVVRTNWDQDPDAAGNVELSYVNNWQQTCIGVVTNSNGDKDYYMALDIDNDGIDNINDPDIDGDGIMNGADSDIDDDGLLNDQDNSPYGLSECLSYTDCNGVEFGNDQYDCNGVCAGPSITGDINLDEYLNELDLDQYALDIIADDWNSTSCNDLDNDGVITVSDMSLLVNCIANSEQITRDNQSEPCDFGMSITNPNDTVTLSIGELNLEDQYVDIHILNPNNEVLGYQFEIGNVEILSIENLVPNYPITPSFANGNNIILGVSYEDSLIIKNYDPAPLCRIYYSSIQENICIESITDIVNQNYENVITINNTESCLPNISVLDQDGILFNMYPNPASSTLDISLNLDVFSDFNISINNMLGQTVISQDFKSKELHYSFDVDHLLSGVYMLVLELDDRKYVKSLIIKK